jgi:hypothetical protein
MRILASLLFIFFTSCHREPWQHTSIRNGNSNYDMAKLTYPPSHPMSGIELELTRTGKEVYGYVNVYQYEFPPYENDIHATTLTITTNSAKRTFVIPLFQGGQKARLTDECLDYLLQNLELKPTVTLSSGHFLQELESSNFERHYNVLLRKAPILNPRSMVTFELF